MNIYRSKTPQPLHFIVHEKFVKQFVTISCKMAPNCTTDKWAVEKLYRRQFNCTGDKFYRRQIVPATNCWRQIFRHQLAGDKFSGDKLSSRNLFSNRDFHPYY